MPGVAQFIIIVEVAQLGLPVGLEPGQLGGGQALAEGKGEEDGDLVASHLAMLEYSDQGIVLILH